MRDFNYTLSFDSYTPLYRQIADHLKEAITSSVFAPGDRMPTEDELGAGYKVSRVTVRQALKRLEEDKYIVRKAGRGTYVAEQKISRMLSGNVSSFTLMCRSLGTVPGARTLRKCLEEPTQELAEDLRLQSGEPVFTVQRVRYSNDEPVVIETDYFPAAFDFLMDEDLNHNSLYGLINERKGIRFTRASRDIEIVYASRSEAALLNVHPGYPLLRIEGLTESEDGSVTTCSVQLYLGDKFKLHV